jgi:hypothetical protein
MHPTDCWPDFWINKEITCTKFYLEEPCSSLIVRFGDSPADLRNGYIAAIVHYKDVNSKFFRPLSRSRRNRKAPPPPSSA